MCIAITIPKMTYFKYLVKVNGIIVPLPADEPETHTHRHTHARTHACTHARTHARTHTHTVVLPSCKKDDHVKQMVKLHVYIYTTSRTSLFLCATESHAYPERKWMLVRYLSLCSAASCLQWTLHFPWSLLEKITVHCQYWRKGWLIDSWHLMPRKPQRSYCGETRHQITSKMSDSLFLSHTTLGLKGMGKGKWQKCKGIK